MKKDEEEDTTDEEEDIDEEGLEDLDLEEGEEGMGSRTIQVATRMIFFSCLILPSCSFVLFFSLLFSLSLFTELCTYRLGTRTSPSPSPDGSCGPCT